MLPSLVHAQDTLLTATSPGNVLTVTFSLDAGGTPPYRIDRLGRPVVLPSPLGVALQEGPQFTDHLVVVGVEHRTEDETWGTVWGETRRIRNHYHEMAVRLATAATPAREMGIVFRVYDDGVGFRYEWPEQPDLEAFAILDEKTGFRLTGDHTAWWIPAYRDNRYEYLFQETPLATLDTVHTPLTMKTAEGLYLSFHEAALWDFASMTLAHTGNHTLKADLVPWADGVKVYGQVPFVSPWRTIQVSDTPGGLVTSYLILNLNEPNRLDDVSWIEPGKYVGIWWGMHTGTMTWNSGPTHGATTENTKRYIDFAARHGFPGVLVEGWNLGWDQEWWAGEGDRFRFMEPMPDYDIAEVTRYATEQGVRIIGHHETGAAIDNYEAQMDSAFAYAARHGMNAVKTGYVGTRLVGSGVRQWHHGQYGVRHYNRSIVSAAQHEIMLDIHEPIKDTGLRRTYPNVMTREGARGMEYDAWAEDGGNPPSYHALLPFTRSLAGPFDYTPGVLEFFYPNRPNNRVNMTTAKALALYVTIYSPLHMVAGLPEDLEGHPALRFIEHVPTDWDTTLVPHGDIGRYATFVRKDRHSDSWYVGSVTDDTGRLLDLPLHFLDNGRAYVAEIWADAEDTDWKANPTPFAYREEPVTDQTVLHLRLAPGGGCAIRIRPAG